MNLLDRLSTHLREVLVKSIHLAAELHNTEVQPIHLLFVLTTQKGSVGAEILGRCKITSTVVERDLINLPSLPPGAPGLVATATTPLSSATKAVLERAMIIAQENQHTYIGTEHLLAAILALSDSAIPRFFNTTAADLKELQKQIDAVIANASHFPHLSEVNDVMERMHDSLHDSFPLDQNEPDAPPPTKRGQPKKQSALEFFATHLTDPEIQKGIDPVIGREHEIERVIQILSRRTKNNPLLLGDPGVGKTAIVEGLAKRILEGKVPDLLLNKKIYALDMSMMIAGTIYRGEFESRLRQVIDEVLKNPNLIIFIDEIHNIVGAGSNQGTMDAANILKPALSRGQIRCIGATTPAEYKKYIENDAALERRFQPVMTREPSVEHTIGILQGIKKNYETFHSVVITDEAVVAAVKLSQRYITNKFLPDKAIDILDETAAAKRLAARGVTHQSKVARLNLKLEKVIAAKELAASQDQFDQAVACKKEEEELKLEIKKQNAIAAQKKARVLGTVTDRDIVLQIAKIIGTSPRELLLDDKQELATLEARLKEFVVGQDSALGDVARLIRQAKLGLSNPDRPLASFMFVGESGVGKTELAKALAKVLYANSDALIKLDMSEFNEGYSVSKLLGSPAGYVGYKESNQFTDKIKLNPYSVILFDEIDKAHRDVIKLLLQILENGEVTDATGKRVSLRQTIIILTTSLGADEIKKNSFGFGGGQLVGTDTKNRLTEKLKEFFTPEVMNRIDQICLFEPLASSTLTHIAALELKRFNERLKEYHTTVDSDEKTLAWIINQLPSQKGGAREVRRFIRARVEDLFSDLIMRRKVKSSYSLQLDNNKLALR